MRRHQHCKGATQRSRNCSNITTNTTWQGKEIRRRHLIIDYVLYYLTNAENDPIIRLYVPLHYRSGVIMTITAIWELIQPLMRSGRSIIGQISQSQTTKTVSSSYERSTVLVWKDWTWSFWTIHQVTVRKQIYCGIRWFLFWLARGFCCPWQDCCHNSPLNNWRDISTLRCSLRDHHWQRNREWESYSQRNTGSTEHITCQDLVLQSSE